MSRPPGRLGLAIGPARRSRRPCGDAALVGPEGLVPACRSAEYARGRPPCPVAVRALGRQGSWRCRWADAAGVDPPTARSGREVDQLAAECRGQVALRGGVSGAQPVDEPARAVEAALTRSRAPSASRRSADPQRGARRARPGSCGRGTDPARRRRGASARRPLPRPPAVSRRPRDGGPRRADPGTGLLPRALPNTQTTYAVRPVQYGTPPMQRRAGRPTRNRAVRVRAPDAPLDAVGHHLAMTDFHDLTVRGRARRLRRSVAAALAHYALDVAASASSRTTPTASSASTRPTGRGTSPGSVSGAASVTRRARCSRRPSGSPPWRRRPG